MTAYIIDNSALARYIQGDPTVVARIKEIERAPADFQVTCPPQVLEYCYSAPRGQYDEYREDISLGFPLEHHPEVSDVLDIQQALWENGYFRAVKTVDILIAAYAILNDVEVLHCDHDYEYIAKVTPLRQEYIAPPNS